MQYLLDVGVDTGVGPEYSLVSLNITKVLM